MLTLQHRAPPAETTPTERLMLEHWLHLPFFLFLLYLLWKYTRNAAPAWLLWGALFIKLACGLLLGWLYQNYLGGGDTWLYHDQAVQIADLARSDVPAYSKFLLFNQTEGISVAFKDYSNSFFFIKILSLLHLLTGNSYWWSGVYLSLFSFFGSWFLVKQISRYFPMYRWAAYVAFLFIPSVAFWMSGVTKDSVLMGSLCLSVGYFLKISEASTRKEVVYTLSPLLIALYLFWKIKFFLAAVLIVLLSAYLFTKFLSTRINGLQSKSRQLFFWLALLIGLAFVASFAHPNFTIDFFLRHILYNYKNLSAITDASVSHLSFPDLEPSITSVLAHSPSAIAQMLFRPFIWEAAPVFYRFMEVENLLLMLCIVSAVWEVIQKRNLPKLPSFWAVLLIFFLIASVLVTLPTPNLGSLSRYRAPLLPFFMVIVLAWGPWQRWWHTWCQKRR